MQFKGLAASVAVFASLAVAVPTEVSARAPVEAYGCCGLGKRAQFDARCCPFSVEEVKRSIAEMSIKEEIFARAPVEAYGCCGLGKRNQFDARCCPFSVEEVKRSAVEMTEV